MARRIPRRLVIKGVGAAIILTAARATGCGDEEPDDTSPPDSGPSGDLERSDLNVLHISVDELNLRFLGHAGHDLVQTPNLDALAAQGLRLTQAYVTAPLCAPTRQSLLTGLHPLEHGQYTNFHVLNPQHPTLAQLAGEQGFTTACFGKLHTMADEAAHSFGFDTLLSVESGAPWLEVRRGYAEGLDEPEPDPDDAARFAEMPFNFGGAPLDHLELSDDWILVQEAIAWLREHVDARFFLYVSLSAPHYPFELPREHYYQYDPEEVELPQVVMGDLDDSPQARWRYESMGWGEMTEAQHRLVMARYLGAVSWVDRLVGMLLGELDSLGLAERTLVAFSSDHGDMCGEKGLWLKSVFFESVVRKPLLLRMPGWLPPGAEDALMLSEVDLWPTLLGLVEATEGLVEWDLSGEDLSAAVLGSQQDRPELVYATLGAPDGAGAPKLAMVCSERWKLIRYRDPQEGDLAHELYDLESDPWELANLAGDPDHALHLGELDAALTAFLGGLREPLFGEQALQGQGEWADEGD